MWIPEILESIPKEYIPFFLQKAAYSLLFVLQKANEKLLEVFLCQAEAEFNLDIASCQGFLRSIKTSPDIRKETCHCGRRNLVTRIQSKYGAVFSFLEIFFNPLVCDQLYIFSWYGQNFDLKKGGNIEKYHMSVAHLSR